MVCHSSPTTTNFTNMKLSPQEKKDLDKYTKFLALKTTQIIVHSRIGEKISTECKPQINGQDWFNLNVTDLPDVLSETKRALNGELITTYIPLCVEIILRTMDGDEMALETWSLSLLPEQCEYGIRIIHLIYNKMGILLKSLVSVTRVLPGYRLSRSQGGDSYILMYRIYMDKPQLHQLGIGYKQLKIGQICTPIGTLQLSVAYRTKLAISPTQVVKNNAMMVKSDHFNADSVNTRKSRLDDIGDLTKPLRPGPFADPKPQPCSTPPLNEGISRLLSMAKSRHHHLQDNATPENGDDETFSQKSTSPYHSPRDEDSSSLDSDKNSTVDKETEEGGGVEKGDEQEEKNDNSDEGEEGMKTPINPTGISTDQQQDEIPDDSSRKSLSTSELLVLSGQKQQQDDCMIQELYAPFANNGPLCDLMQFYRQCKRQPPLESPQKSPTADEISELLKSYELKLPEYDAVVKSFCSSPEYSLF